jgi:phosphoglycolate phosphatase
MSLVLFDIDGTLLRNAGPHHKMALVAGIRKATGLDTTLDGIATAGMLDRELIFVMLRSAGASARRIQVVMKQVVEESQNAYLLDCAADLRSHLCPRLPSFLSDLMRHGFTLGVVSGNLSRIGWKKLELAGIRHYFSIGAFAEDGRSRARLAQIAAARARKIGSVSRSSSVSLIGDHPNDIAAARANRFRAVAVATGIMTYDELRRAKPDILVRDLTELRLSRLL